MQTRISLAQFGILFAVLIALGAVAHADTTRGNCGSVEKVEAKQTSVNGQAPQTYATVVIEGQSYPVGADLAQIALTAKAAGRRVCAVYHVEDPRSVDLGTSAGKTEITFTITDERHP